MQRLLACTSLEEQKRFYDEEWDTWRWRLLFVVMLNRRVFNRTYSPEFFRHVENPSFPRHFRDLVERTLRELPVGDNYFLHFLIQGRYPAEVPGGLPAYLEAGPAWADAAGRLLLVDGTFTDYLRTLPERSLDGFSLSNICEWLDAEGLEALFAEILRTARPGAMLCFRNFVGWTDVPARFAAAFPLEPGEDAWILRDRSLMQRRFARSVVRGQAA
jgi:S-adenosylmethionine-diacylglycerol 3-amino-3-carboxypropyl transferase